MMHRLRRMRHFLAMGMLVAVLLSGCCSTGGEPSASSTLLTEEQTEEETMAQELQKQIISVLNVNLPLDDRVTSDAALEQAADFFLTCLLQDPDSDPAGVTNPTDLDGMLTNNRNDAFVYDGTLSAVQVGKKILEDLKKLDEQLYRFPESIAIVHGSEGEKSAWLVLVHYPVNGINTGEDETEEDAGGIDSGNSQPTEPDA